MFGMKTLLATVTGIFLVSCSAPSPGDSPASLIEWNETILDLAKQEDGFLTLRGLRTATMIHIAAYEILATGDRLRGLANPKAKDAENMAAVQSAIFAIAVSQYPSSEYQFKEIQDRYLSSIEHTSDDIDLGTAIASLILSERRNDGWDSEAEYAWHPMAPGVYAEFRDHSGTPDGFIFGSGWAKAEPFALVSSDQFRSVPPPTIDSPAYTRAFNEVRSAGAQSSSTRTEDQHHLALWWKDFAENSHNRLARDLVITENLDAREASRLFALINIAIYDAYISSFDNKFFYNHWRPYTAIRWAEHDDNPDTAPDSLWTNTHNHTYAFPSYPSAHGTACAASMSIFTNVFGDAYSFEMTTDSVDSSGPFSEPLAMQPPNRQFASFEEAARECADSRIYLGIHFRYDSDAGILLGKDIGQHILDVAAD